MKAQFFILITLSAIINCYGPREIIKERYPDGSKKIVYIYHTVKKDPIVKMVGYRPNGDLSFTGFLLEGKLHGLFTQWYFDKNQMMEQFHYSLDKRDGLTMSWYKNGQKREGVNYCNNLKDGAEFLWYENGNLKSEGNLELNKQTGQWTYYYENGQIKERGSYNGGRYEVLPSYSSKSPEFIPQKDGLWEYRFENGERAKEEYWENGKLLKKSTIWTLVH